MSLGLVMIDLDETLLKQDKSYDEKRFDRIVEQLDDQGVIVCIATGNSFWKLEEYIGEHTREITYLAGENGNFITKKDEILKINTFPTEKVQKIFDLKLLRDNIEVFVCTGFNQYTKGYREKNTAAVLNYYAKHELINSYDSFPDGKEPVKLAVYSPNNLEENKEIVAQINAMIPEVTGVTSGATWIDFYHVDGGKGYTVRYLQDKYNISEANTISFGDSLNDAPMMDYSKYAVAMANADPELKEGCNYVIGTNEEGSVMDVLEQYLENSNLEFLKKYAK